MEDFKILTCRAEKDKIILVFKPRFMPDSEVYSAYTHKKEIVNSMVIKAKIVKDREKPLMAKIEYGHDCYTNKFSQICNMNGVLKTKEDSARYWFDKKEPLLGIDGYVNRSEQIKNHFKDNSIILNELNFAVELLEKESLSRKKESALKKIQEGIQELNSLI